MVTLGAHALIVLDGAVSRWEREGPRGEAAGGVSPPSVPAARSI